MIHDLRTAFAFLTILPVRPHPERPPGHAFALFPLVGLAIGATLALASAALHALSGASPGAHPSAEPLRAFLLLALWAGLSGGLHLDGWADACDGLWAAVPPARRLEILQDPRTGAWAVIGLALLLLGKFAALHGLPGALLLAAPIAGRCATVIAACAFPYARSGGLGGWFRQGLGRRELWIACASALLLCAALAWVDARALWALGAAPLVALGYGGWAARRLGGGLTGDLYGAVCELTELLCIVGFALLA